MVKVSHQSNLGGWGLRHTASIGRERPPMVTPHRRIALSSSTSSASYEHYVVRADPGMCETLPAPETMCKHVLALDLEKRVIQFRVKS